MELVLNGEVVARGNITAQTTVHGERVESHESAVMLVETCTRAPPGYSQDASRSQILHCNEEEREYQKNTCSACGIKWKKVTDEEEEWLECSKYGRWYHLKCTGRKRLPSKKHNWYCNSC